MGRDLALVIEDSVSAILRIRAALEQRRIRHIVISRPTKMDAAGITGTSVDFPKREVSASWEEVHVLFCDYQIPGPLLGDAVMKMASHRGVPGLVAMSSAAHFNARLREAGAQRCHLKQVVVGGLETGAFDSLLPPPIPLEEGETEGGAPGFIKRSPPKGAGPWSVMLDEDKGAPASERDGQG
jgi:hypothetical protein